MMVLARTAVAVAGLLAVRVDPAVAQRPPPPPLDGTAASAVPESWTTVPQRRCPDWWGGHMNGYRTAVEAVAACESDAACLAVFDEGCDNAGNWVTCSDGGTSGPDCMYMAPAPPSAANAFGACVDDPQGQVAARGTSCIALSSQLSAGCTGIVEGVDWHVGRAGGLQSIGDDDTLVTALCPLSCGICGDAPANGGVLPSCDQHDCPCGGALGLGQSCVDDGWGPSPTGGYSRFADSDCCGSQYQDCCDNNDYGDMVCAHADMGFALGIFVVMPTLLCNFAGYPEPPPPTVRGFFAIFLTMAVMMTAGVCAALAFVYLVFAVGVTTGAHIMRSKALGQGGDLEGGKGGGGGVPDSAANPVASDYDQQKE